MMEGRSQEKEQDQGNWGRLFIASTFKKKKQLTIEVIKYILLTSPIFNHIRHIRAQ
jgi:hypothetical protein